MKEKKVNKSTGMIKLDSSMYDNLRVNEKDTFELFQLNKYEMTLGTRFFVESSTLVYSVGGDIEMKYKYKKEYFRSVMLSMKHLNIYLKICGSGIKYCQWYPGNVFTKDIFVPNEFISGINIYNCSFNFKTKIQLNFNMPYRCIVENTYYTSDKLIEGDLITIGLHGTKEVIF